MKVSGFTVVRNAELMGYPVVQSIRSILPIVDEFVVGVGQSDDNTKQLILNINNPKIRIFDSVWDTKKVTGGLMLSEKTNEALAQCKNDWCFYLQADEVVSEKDHSSIVRALSQWESTDEVQGLLFNYIHFYGSYDVIATARNWYRSEVRIVKKSSGIQSVGDAQSFRVAGEKAKVRHSGASIYHYGWVKPPQAMGQKSKLLSRWWHGNKLDNAFDNFEYNGTQYGLKKFLGTHPEVMKDLVSAQSWKFSPKPNPLSWSLKEWNYLASDVFEKIFGFRIGEYKPYRLLK